MKTPIPYLPSVLLIGTLTCFAASIAAEEPPAEAPEPKVYKSRDQSGTPVFSDRASENAEAIEVPQPQTYPSRVFTEPADGFDYEGVKSGQDAAPTPAFNFDPLFIASPVQDEVIRNNAGNLTVQVQVPPALPPGHELRLLLDEKVFARYKGGPFTLEHIDRGQHQLRLEIVDLKTGKIRKASNTVTFTLQRFSKLH